MDLLQGGGDRLVVVDVETTGVYNKDRIVEVAAVTLAPDGQIVDEWDTLVDPGRDVGPTDIHRISASMVSMAPRFDEIAAALAQRLEGAVLVAHNLPFDARMLTNEFERSGALLDPGVGVCTLQITGQRLSHACDQYGIPLDGHHRALADARATSLLLQAIAVGDNAAISPAHVDTSELIFLPRTLRRDVADEEAVDMPYLARMADRMYHYSENGSALIYMDLLDWALADLVLTDTEQSQLTALAFDLGLTGSDIHTTHDRYVDALVAAALRDGIVSETEQSVLLACADVLGVDQERVIESIAGRESETGLFQITPGATVCFTGSATYPDGEKLPRSVLETAAARFGMQPVKSVTKKNCDLLVASDPTSQSGKAKKARNYDIPISSTHDFLITSPGGAIPIVT